MISFELIRQNVRQKVVEQLSAFDYISSVTFVGSFEHSPNLESISDIDIIIIIKELSVDRFQALEQSLSRLSGKDLGLDDYEVVLNLTFGPLKLNTPKTVVFHAMIYDLPGHRRHVIESPFTCLDWDRYDAVYGTHLRDIYPSFPVQIDDIIQTRRGLHTYLDDLEQGIITYRKYVIKDSSLVEEKQVFQIDERHQKEYAYHIVKFLLLNTAKVLQQQNGLFTESQLISLYLSRDDAFKEHLVFFEALYRWKKHNSSEPEHILERLRSFISFMGVWLSQIAEHSRSVYFIRHAKTAQNDGRFLGVRTNPSIEALPDDTQVVKLSVDKAYTSELCRTQETAALMGIQTCVTNALLNEIDYGQAEGMHYADLQVAYPHITDAWGRLEDPAFPGGESQMQVQQRVLDFIKQHLLTSDQQTTAVFTHNVVLRALLGTVLKRPVYEWHRITPQHMELFRFIIFKGVLIPAWSREQRIECKDHLIQWKG